MGIETTPIDLGAFNTSLEARMDDINSQVAKAQGMFKIVDSGFEGLDSDYLDDGIFNSSKGNILSKSSLTMDKVLEMSGEEIEELLKSGENSDEIQESIQKAKQLYSQYTQQFKKLENEIKQINNQMKTLAVQVEQAQNLQKELQNDFNNGIINEICFYNIYNFKIYTNLFFADLYSRCTK